MFKCVSKFGGILIQPKFQYFMPYVGTYLRECCHVTFTKNRDIYQQFSA